MEAAVQQPLHSCLIRVNAGVFLCLRYDLHSTRIRTRRIFEAPVPRLAVLRLLMRAGFLLRRLDVDRNLYANRKNLL